jgi:chromosome segregation ATPase
MNEHTRESYLPVPTNTAMAVMNRIGRIRYILRRGVLLQTKTTLRQKAGFVEPHLRTEIATEVAEELDEDERELLVLEGWIIQAKEYLRESQENEKFLGMRARKYRKALDEQARQLRDEDKVLEDEGSSRSVLNRRMEQWEKDEDALQVIESTHRQILIRCEEIRREIMRLERKRDEIQSMRGECEEYVGAAGEVVGFSSFSRRNEANLLGRAEGCV